MTDRIGSDPVRHALVNTASEMMAGTIDVITGTRELNRLRKQGDLPMSHAFEVIEAVESETDQYPVGNVREQYSPDLLARLDAWAAACIERATPSLRDACAAVIREYKGDSNELEADNPK